MSAVVKKEHSDVEVSNHEHCCSKHHGQEAKHGELAEPYAKRICFKYRVNPGAHKRTKHHCDPVQGPADVMFRGVRKQFVNFAKRHSILAGNILANDVREVDSTPCMSFCLRVSRFVRSPPGLILNSIVAHE